MTRTVEALKGVYTHPYRVIFAAAVGLSAHGLFTAAVRLGRIPAWLAWAYVLIVDLLAVAAYRTWRQATESDAASWAWAVAALAAVGTVSLNTLAAYPELAATWVGPAIAGFPPIAALLATALRMTEQRLQVTADGSGVDLPEPQPAPEPAPQPEPVTPATPDRLAARTPRPVRTLAAIPAVTPDVAGIVAGHVQAGGQVTDPELTAAVAAALGCSDRTARRRLQPYREGVAA